MVSFAVQKLLSLIESHLFIFVFIFMTLGGGSKELLLLMSKSVLTVFSSKSFIVSGDTKDPNGQSNFEKEKWSWRNQAL